MKTSWMPEQDSASLPCSVSQNYTLQCSVLPHYSAFLIQNNTVQCFVIPPNGAVFSFSLNWPFGLIQSLGCKVCQLYLCLCHRRKLTYRWTGDFWLKEYRLYCHSSRHFWGFVALMIFSVLIFVCFWVFANQQTEPNNGGVSRGRVCGCGCWGQ